MIDKKLKTIFSIGLILLMALGIVMCVPFASAVPTRATAAYIDVAPHTLGVGQTMTVNLWVYPAPATLNFAWLQEAFEGFTVTFTRPDGSKDAFMPVDASGGLAAGESEMIGAIWFYYTPNQAGTWTVSFSYPGQTLGSGSEAVQYAAATSQTITFTVQNDPVNAGVLNGYPFVALPTDYWNRPINADNREWYQISGDWLQGGYSNAQTRWNPYSTGPSTAHIVWTRSVGPGGIIGGDWGSISYGATTASPPIIMNGNVFYTQPGSTFQCVDLRTGALLYTASGSPSIGWQFRPTSRDLVRNTPETQGAQISPFLVETGTSQWKFYDPTNGALLKTITGVLAPAAHGYGQSGTFSINWAPGDSVCYIVRQGGWNTTIPLRLAQNELIKWDYNQVTGNNWTTGIVWRTSMKQADGSGPGEGQRGSNFMATLGASVGMVTTTGEDKFYGFDLTTGQQLWVKQVDYPLMGAIYCYTANGKWLSFDSVTRREHCYDINTGNELWVSDPIGTYPWGSEALYRSADDKAFYVGDYAMLTALDQNTGATLWTFGPLPTTQTVFNAYAFYGSPAVAGGKLYICTTEHTPTQPRIKGNLFYCIDTTTGKEVWHMLGAINSVVVAEGYILGTNENDGLLYAYGKGQTETTVATSQTQISKGQSVGITGTVLDLSPAQPSTPCVSSASMSDWMNYQHMQVPLASEPTGVQVTLTATKSDGTTINIGTATSNSKGIFGIMWTPPDTGIYTVTAKFTGDDSYWSSEASTAQTVVATSASPAPTTTVSPSVAPPPSSEAPSMTLYIALAGVAVAIIIIAAVALVIKRRK